MVSNVTKRGIPKAQEVQPIKNQKDIQKIKQFLQGKKDRYGQPDLRNYMLFVVGINIGLRAGDLLSLKVADVADLAFDDNGNVKDIKIKEEVRIKEEKTDKYRTFGINNSAKEAIMMYLDTVRNVLRPDDYLFKSYKNKNEHITVESAHKIIKNLMRDLNIKGNYGTHTLRKTFAYHVYINNVKDNPGILHELMKILNHSSESITLRYIGITKDVITDIYRNLNL